MPTCLLYAILIYRNISLPEKYFAESEIITILKRSPAETNGIGY
jgi:hypothetical protein